MDGLIERIRNPGKEYRAMPLWSWNDRLEPDELQWQVREMDKAGMGGYFMHARDGLKTEYLSDEWFECVRACIAEGSRYGLKSWGYDEYGFPSGTAGGIVPGLDDVYQARGLEIEEAENCREAKCVIGRYSYNDKTKEIARLSTDTGNVCGANEKLYAVKDICFTTRVDVLNKDAIKAFIELTHERYYNKLKADFERGISGFFTDETAYRGKIPWSYKLPEEFIKRNGYDILDFLPALFIECKGYEKIRYDFWSAVSNLFLEAFGKQIYEWCEAHGCQSAGHYEYEEEISKQMQANAGVMPFYEYMHIPGIDWVRREINTPVLPRQVGSVAGQLGRKFVLSENFAMTGWDMSFEEMKWILEWQFANGVNLFSQHVAAYTIGGRRKRDFPLATSYQNPWWDEYRLLTDYFARLSLLLAEGKKTARVLLLHPMKSAWLAFDGSINCRLEKLNKDFLDIAKTMMGLHIDHDYGDETIIAKYGKVEGRSFVVGECMYDAVVMPPMIGIDKSTLELLRAFADNGGKIICTGSFPAFCSGKEEKELSQLKKKVRVCNQENLRSCLDDLGVFNISLLHEGNEAREINCCVRELENRTVIFLANQSKTEEFDVVAALHGAGKVQRINLENVAAEDMEYRIEDGITQFKLKFLPMQSHVVFFEKNTDAADGSKSQSPCMIREVDMGGTWRVEEADMNALTLDYCDIRINNGDWRRDVPVVCLMDELMPLKGICDFELRFRFSVESGLEKMDRLFMAIETPELFKIELNGNTVSCEDQGWWRDKSIKKLDIRPLVRLGTNEILLCGKFKQPEKAYEEYEKNNLFQELWYDMELESIYILGDFSVVSLGGYSHGSKKAVFTPGPFVLRSPVTEVKSGDLTVQGYCFFSGRILLSQNVPIAKAGNDRILWKLHRHNAAVSKVYVNGKHLKSLPWAPYEVDLTDFVCDGDNKISIELFSGNRNLLGPHHNIHGELHSVWPGSFGKKTAWIDNGFESGAWQDIYCFTAFGIC